MNQLEIVNQVLSKIGEKPVSNVLNQDKSLLISQQLNLFHQELLLKAPWRFALAYFFSDTPNTTNLEANPFVQPQFQSNFTLPADYGRFFRWQYPNSPTFGMIYQIMQGIIQTNTSNVALMYIMNNTTYPMITNASYLLALIYYTAYQVTMPLTNNAKLEQSNFQKYELHIGDAINQNFYEMEMYQTQYNDFNRMTFI